MGSEGRGEVVELTFVFFSHLSEGDCGGVLLVDEFSKSGFSLDEAVGDVHFFAELGQPDNHFERLDVVGNDDQLGLLVLDEFGHVVETELEVEGLGVLDFLL